MKKRMNAQVFTGIIILSFLLAGCGQMTGATPTPLPTVVLGSDNTGTVSTPSASHVAGSVTASGKIAPLQQIDVVSGTGGKVEVIVAEGDAVKAGQVVVKLAGSEKLNAAVEASQFELLSAQQAVQSLKDHAAKAAADAQQRLANARKTLDDAQKRRTWRQYRNGSDAAIAQAQADLILANDALKKAQDNYNPVSNKADDDVYKAAALSALSAAQKAHDRAIANLNYLTSMPNQLDVDVAEADLQAAKAEVDSAQQDWDRLKNGPDPDALALAEARVKNAQAALLANQASLADLQLAAPFDATVGRVDAHAGEWAAPGQTLLVLVDTSKLRVETTDLSERDIPDIAIGQSAQVTIKALNQDVQGKVVQIAPLADDLGGDVIYKAVIELDTIPTGTRLGMSVDVTFAGQ